MALPSDLISGDAPGLVLGGGRIGRAALADGADAPRDEAGVALLALGPLRVRGRACRARDTGVRACCSTDVALQRG